MAEEAAILSRLKARPNDLEALLVYSDWLEEHGFDDRATFLRRQHEILGMRPKQRGIIGKSRNLEKLARSFPSSWLSIVSRPRLVGTCWCGHDSDGAFYVFRYQGRGKLNYTSPSGTFLNGTWRQIGNVVRMEMNRHYADYEGIVTGDFLRGKASNVVGRTWRWHVFQTNDPELCDPGNPIRTIFDDHLRDVPRHRRRSSGQ